MKKYDLDGRFEDFAALIILLFDKTPKSFSADYLAKQLIRSGFLQPLILENLPVQVLTGIERIN